ncbi:LPD23 domain-containing protein [Phascolarctobacterium succinatutens]|uniref:LPD23 domain-containing protein n=1 Tax=Phascolarctobacterium succinatutens TaxID=626940 RepID=UPI0026F06358|nr:LPD23 domain-containing protein [Phascolarctobacterium succinatutens]
MGTFNFSNMQGSQQQETQNIPREFRPAVEQAKTEPVGSYGNNKTGFWDGVKNFFSGSDVDTSTGFIDETGTWNNGNKQELAKYYPTQKSAEELEKDRLGSLWDRTYKKYQYSKDDVLLEAKKISAATNIPENAILANADNLANARNVYNYQQKAMDPQAVFKAYPELSELAKLSDTDAAIALHNLKNVRQTQGIIEAAKTGWELDNLMSERGRMGYAAMNGKELTDADIARLGEIEKAQKNTKELPGLFEDPMSAIVGGTVQSGKMMLRNALNGQKMGVYGAGFGALLGGIAGGGATLGAGTAAGAAAGAKIGYSVGSRIGMAQDMYDEIAGNNYLDYRGYKDKQGRQLLTDNQARSYAAVAAALETGIEFSNADKILNIIKGGASAQSIKEIISSAKDSTELQSLLAAYLRDSAKNIGTVAISESAEEGVQEMSNRIISDIAAANNSGGDIPTYTARDIIVGGLEASWQALPASIGFGAGAHGASTVSFMRRASAALQLKSEEQKANLRDANGISMLRSLAEDIKNNALFKKSPEVYNEVLNNQLKGTELETINIDTEYVLNQQGGYELLKSAAKAAGIGEQYLKDIIDTKADLKISTADYVSKLLPTEIGAHLEDYITFSDISECLARNREYAGRMRREMDRILAYENRQREDALNTYLDNNFHTPETREIAEAVLRRFPDNPKEGVKEIRKSLQAKIDEPLNQIIEELEKGMGNGVAVVEIPEYDNQMRGRGIKVSNNDPWYQRYYKENKHKPSKMELRELAREIWTGHNEYGLFGWENRTSEDNQWYESNKASMEATEEAIRRLDALTPALEEIDPGELSITEGLSEEGFEVYRKLRGKLEGAESKEVRQAAQMSAILAARMADRMAELHRQVGHTKYTALDYARSIGLIRSESEAAEQKFNQTSINTVHIGTETYVQRPAEEVLKSYYKLVNQEPYIIIQVIEGGDFDSRKKNAGMIFNTLYKNNDGEHVIVKNKYNEDIDIPRTAFKEMAGHAKKANLFELVPYIEELLQKSSYLHTRLPDPKREKRMKPNVEEYRMYARKVQINGTEYYAKIIIRKEKSQKLFLHDIDITKIKNEVSGSGNGGADYSSASKPDKLTSVVNSIPWWLNEVKTKLILVNKVQQDDNTLDQKAWHGTPYNFERFDIGKIGDGVGDQVHGWGLYFAKDRKISEAYKEVLGADAGAVIVDGVTYKIDKEGDWATAAGKKLIDNDPLEFVLNTFDAMTGNKNKESAIKSLKERIAGTKRTANTESYIAKLKEAINIIEKADVKYENTSRLLKVEVPENDVLLDEQKTFINQNKNVQALLKNTIESLDDARSMKFWEHLLNFKLRAFDNAGKVQFKIDGFNKLADGIGKLLESNSNTFGYRTLARSLERYGYSKEEIEKLKSDGEYRNQEQQKLRSQAAALEEELERAKAEDAAAKEEVINQAKADISGTLGGMFSGNKIYDALAKAMGEEDYNWRGASELLNEHGIKGIAYEGMKDGRCFVVFDDKAVDIIERYNQSAGERAMTANTEKLKEAKEMLTKDADMKTIYKKTGWHRGADGKWRFEIPDNLDKIDAAKFPEEGYAIPLGEIYANPKLYEAYPWLADVMVQSEPMEEQTLGVAAGEGYIGINSNLLGDGIKQEIIINGIKYKRIVSKDGAKAGKFFSNGDEFVEYALNHGIKNNMFDKKAAVNSLKELIQDKESVIEKLKSKNNNGQFNKGILDRQKELSKIRVAAEFVGRADISFNEIKKADRDVEAAHKNLAETLIHEIQHIIQNAEGFAGGGSPARVNGQMKRQLQKYDEEIERLHPKGKEYVTAMLEYDIADFEHDTGEISDEAFADIKNKVKELEDQIPEEKVKRLQEIKELQTDLQWQAEDESSGDYEKYFRLHGEQEARVASMKARLYTMGASQERIDNEVLNAIDNPIIVFGGRSYSMDSDQRGLWQLKGQTAFKTTGEKVISLFKAADQSTFMHEMAHIYLHDMLALAELPNAPKQLLDDVATINRWAAWNDTQFAKEYKGTAMESEFKKLNEQMKTAVAKGSVDIEGKKMTLEQMQRLWMQERFARGFENYLKSGDAPTEATRSIFRRFKQWLTKIYRAFSQIGGAPSKEVKAVMDRMIASEDEIDIAMRKKGVDDFAESGGMDYLEGSTKDVYRRMVERAKADAEEKVLKIALKDVKEDYRQQEKELFEREEAEYREKLAAEPVFIIQEHIKNNPDMSTSVICETLGMNVEDYVKQLKEYGGSLDAAVEAHMKEFKEGIDNSGIDAQYFRERAEEVVQESKYRKLATAMELEAFERIAKKQRNLTTQIEADGKNDAAEKGVIKTVDKMTRQSKQIEELTAETKGLKQDKRELLANVRGLRDAALSHYKDYVQFIETKLEVMPIEDANNYQMWRRKSAQAQYNSEQSLIKGNWDKAVKYKQAQLIYDMFADRAVRNAKQIKKIEDGLKRKQQTISKAKNISADERYAYNHLMYVFGFSDADAPVPPHYEGIMEVLMKADATREEGGLMLESPFFGPDGQTNLPEWFLQAAMNSNKRKAGHKDLSNMQVDLVAQVMHIIYKRGMDNMKLATIKTNDGRTLTVDEAVAEIEGQTRQRMIERANADPTGANKNRWQDDAANFIDQADRVLIKPEVELKKLGDVALRYIYDPLKEAADKELKMAVNMQNKLKGMFDAYSPKELADMRNKRLYDFGSSKITKEQAIMIALNWGTETNQQRVLDGYHVNVAQVKNVLQYLDERDWNLVNSIWKLYDIHWDQIREIEARMTGAVLQKQEAKGFVVVGQDRKIYTLDGGYFPIKYDLRDLRTQEQADAAQQSVMSNIAMSLGKGFLKERTQHKVERRLDLRFEVISGSITDVIHLVAFREPVRDVRRIVLNENFKNLVYNYLGQNAYKNLKKWTSDCWAEEPIPRTAYEKGMAKLRNAQTMGTMGFRVTTALLNIANAPSVAHYMGAVDLLHSLKKFYSAPRRYTDFVFQRSVFMAERAETMDASIHDALKGPNILDGIPGIGKAGEVIKNNAFKMITWTDLMLALPLWQHEYEKTYNAEVDAGRSPQQAREAGVNAGDAAVRWCFGSGRTVDKAAIQRKGSELMKQLTMYYSYNSTVYNALNYKLWEAKIGYKKAVEASTKNKSMALMKAVAHAGDALLMWVLLPAVISALLRAGASGDDDDWKIEKLIKSMGQESLTGIVGGIPVLRDAVPYLMAKVFDEHQFAPKIPIQNTVEQTNRVIQSAVSDKKTISDTLREMGKLTSQVTGAPSTLIDSFTTTLQYLESGFDESVADYLRALIFDKKLKKNPK